MKYLVQVGLRGLGGYLHEIYRGSDFQKRGEMKCVEVCMDA